MKYFTNNQAEQDIRMAKSKQNVSKTFRDIKHLETFCVMRSYVSTAKKQGLNILTVIADVLRGAPWILNEEGKMISSSSL